MNRRPRALRLLSLFAAAFTLNLGSAMSQACDPATLLPDAKSVKVADDFNKLFTRPGGPSGAEWTGADSTYSIQLPDGRVLWLFSDTFLGSVNPDRSRPRDTLMINNSLVVQDGTKLTTLTGGTAKAPASFFVPKQPDSWYWVYDATIEGDSLFVFLIRFAKQGSGVFGFKWLGTDLAELSLKDLKLKKLHPVRADKGVAWGAALTEDGNHTLIYGVEDRPNAGKHAHLARAKRGALTGPWEYWNGKGWTSDPTASARILDAVANEFSVTKVGNGYLLVTMDTSQYLGADLVAYTSCTPQGPWTNRTLLYVTPESKDENFTYNAHAHPEFTKDGQLLISYNQNSLVLAAVFANVDFYRPRFIRVTVPALKR
jgi:hypothetical protein